MNREIKFRGVRVDDGTWIYGWLFRDMLTGKLCIQQTTSEITKDRGHQVISTISREIVEKSMGQLTGLKDKNGKEIYEGDIVKITWTTESTGKYFQQDDRWIDHVLIGKAFIDINFWFVLANGRKTQFARHHQYEIIGNIYENPELLK